MTVSKNVACETNASNNGDKAAQNGIKSQLPARTGVAFRESLPKELPVFPQPFLSTGHSFSSPKAISESSLLHRNLNAPPHHVVSAKGIYLTLSTGRKVIDACGGAAVSCIGHGNLEVASAVMHQMIGMAAVPGENGTIAEASEGGVGYVHTLTYTTTAGEELGKLLLSDYQYQENRDRENGLMTGLTEPNGSTDSADGRALNGNAVGHSGKEAYKPNRWGLSKAYFVGSGSEAMDAALKLSRQYFFELGEALDPEIGSEQKKGRFRYVARRQAYHGNTIGAMGVSSNLPRKKQYTNLQFPNVSWVNPAYEYQYSYWQKGETEQELAERLVKELEDHFLELGPQTVIAFIAEPLVGATSGCTPAPKGYFRGVRQVCDKYGILLILDEVMCGTGRTGTMFAFEQEGIVPDLMTLGKGLGGGYCPIAAVVAHERVIEVLRGGSAAFNHGHTYQAHPISCAAALAVQKILRRDGLVDNCRRMGNVLHSMLDEAFSGRKYVGDIRGRGLFWALEFVQDKKLREPFDAAVGFGPKFQQMAFDEGVAVYPGAGTVDGSKGDHIIISPPYNVTHEELKTIVSLLVEVYEKLESEIDGIIRG